MLEFGRQMRDEYLTQYPILPGAVFTFQQLASNREWKISGSASGVARCNDWLHSAVVHQYDGLDFYGFDNFLKVRALDFLAVGRRAMYAPPDGDLEYLDPCYLEYNIHTGKWKDRMMNRVFPKKHVIIDHTFPTGASGRFTSPLAMVLPSAILAWLIREHDTSSLDGRKVRDIIIVGSEEMKDNIATALGQMISLYTDPQKALESNNMPIAHFEMDGDSRISVQDLIGRLGLTNLPENFDRKSFTFQYVNEIAAATGLALRYFWNQEQSTNRALEEVQQQRQAQKGPETFVRAEQRILNSPKYGILRRFGPRTRMAFFEEVDAQSQLNRSQILKNTADAFKVFNEAGAADGKRLSLESLIAWMQAEGTLPHEIDFKLEDVVLTSDPTGAGEEMTETSDPNPSRFTQGQSVVGGGRGSMKPVTGKKGRKRGIPGDGDGDGIPFEKDFDELDYGEVTINSNYEVIDRRVKTFPVVKLLVEQMEKDTERLEILQAEADAEEFSFEKALKQARMEQHQHFLERIDEFNLDNPERFKSFENLSDSDFREIDRLLRQHDA